jgi:NAD(P)-dependent dehydrogenase (short-subunit alcohol dehydrogenase family)
VTRHRGRFPFPNDRAAAVIIGGAAGIGAATAVELARRGSNVAIVDIDGPAAEQVAGQARALGVRASAHAIDITDQDAVDALPGAVTQAHGGAHILVNCAAVLLHGYFEQVTLEEFRWLLDINLWGTIAVTKVLLPLLQAQPTGHVSNVSSVYGLVGPAGRVAYSTSKFAVRGFTESLAHELEGTGVSLGVVYPGGIRTAIALKGRVAAAVDPADAAAAARVQTAMFRTTPQSAAAAIAEGIARRKGRVLIGGDAKLLDAVARVTPAHYWAMMLRPALDGATDTRPGRPTATDSVGHVITAGNRARGRDSADAPGP